MKKLCYGFIALGILLVMGTAAASDCGQLVLRQVFTLSLVSGGLFILGMLGLKWDSRRIKKAQLRFRFDRIRHITAYEQEQMEKPA